MILKNRYSKFYNLTIVGDRGLGKDFYIKRASELGISRQVMFTGMVKHNEIWKYLSNADVVVSPRLKNKITESGFVSQIPEYLAAGCVILATDVSECDKMLVNCGYLVKPNSEEALAQGIIECFDDHKNWEIISRNAKFKASQWSWEKHVDRLIELYSVDF
jgi:glycosyltransferase involved in cell wall biosynthesis